MRYANEGEATKKLRLRLLRENEGAGKEDVEESRNILNFLSKTRWTVERNQEGGITWLELFIWYKLHHIETPTKNVDPKVTLQRKMADFKRHTRNVIFLC